MYFEVNENENTGYQNLRNVTEIVLQEKRIALNTYIEKNFSNQ